MIFKSFMHAVAGLALACSVQAVAQDAAAPVGATPGPLTIEADKPGPVINRDIFGQFAEHLGQGIYGGVWVGSLPVMPRGCA